MRIGDLRAARYGSRWLIEEYGAGRECDLWAVPAWDERGVGDFAGPFADPSDAEQAMRDYGRSYLPACHEDATL